MRRDHVETRHDRVELAQDAGKRKVSFVSVLAGTLVAYGAFAVLAAIAAAVAKGVGFDTDLSTNDWERLGAAGGAVIALVLFVSYYFGGYVAGRMSRRAGGLNGFLVFALGIVVGVGVAAFANMFTDTEDVLRNLRNIGIPTSSDEWQQIGTVAGIGSLAAMVLGSLLGGGMGERWHGKYLTRAMDPTVGAGVPVTPATTGRGTVVDDGTSILDRSDRDARDTRDDRDDERAIDLDRDGDGDRDRDRRTTLDTDRERTRP